MLETPISNIGGAGNPANYAVEQETELFGLD